MEIRVEHGLEPAEVERRLGRACAENDVEHVAGANHAGRIAMHTPLGRAEATYRIERAAIVVFVTERPAFLPEGMVRRALEGKLAEALAG